MVSGERNSLAAGSVFPPCILILKFQIKVMSLEVTWQSVPTGLLSRLAGGTDLYNLGKIFFYLNNQVLNFI